MMPTWTKAGGMGIASMLWVGLLVGIFGVAAAEPPELTVPACETPPVIDGKLNDACWTNAARLAAFHRLPATAGNTTDTTRVKLACDREWLYLALECRNSDMQRLAQPCRRHDGRINQDDSVEIFLDPGTGGECYYHYMLSYANTRGERRIVKKTRDLSWNIPWRSATQRGTNGWTAEIGLPLYVLTEQGNLKNLRLNICRNLATFGVDGIGERTVKKREHSSWAPLKNSFHEPERFGVVRGLDRLALAIPFLPAVAQASVGRYETAPDRTFYEVAGRLRACSVVSGMVSVVAVDHPVSGMGAEDRATLAIKGMKTREFTLQVPVTSLVQRGVSVRLEQPVTGEILQTYPIVDTSVLTLMVPPLVDRDYYTDESHARIRCCFGMSAEALAGHRLIAKAASGQILVEEKKVVPETVLELPLDRLTNGVHLIRIELLQAAGGKVAGHAIELVKKPPKKEGEVKIDRWNRVVLKNGRPFFPFGVLFNSYSYDNMEAEVRCLAEAGLNTLVFWGGYGKKDGALLLLDLADKYGLQVLDNANYYSGAPNCFHYERMSRHKDAVDRSIQAVKDHPALLAYYSVDEPNLHPDFDNVMEDCRLLYERVHALDGYHPVFMLYARDIPKHPQATAWSDILGYDVYLAGGMDGYYATPNFMAGYTTFLDRRAASVNQPVWMLPLGERLDPGRTSRGLFPEEHRCQAYLAVIHGARGLLYFSYSQMCHRMTWEVLSGLARETRDLAPAVLNRMPAQSVTYEPGLYAPEDNRYPDVQAALFRYPDGDSVLLAANSRMYPVDVTYTVTGLSDGDKVQVMFTNRVLKAKDSSFQDRLDWYATRAYRFRLPASESRVEIKVAIQAHPEQEHKLPRGNPKRACADAMNWVPNASLEEQTLPGIPDFTAPYRVSGSVIGETGALWVVDAENPYHGRYAVRMTRDLTRCWGMFFAGFPPSPDSATPYVLSLYLRGARGGEKATVQMLGRPIKPIKRTFRLTTEWKRYVLPFDVEPRPINLRWIRKQPFLICPHAGATIWVDAIQLEQGMAPTEFTE